MTYAELKNRLIDLYVAYKVDLDTPIIVESPEGKLKIEDITVNFEGELVFKVAPEEGENK